MHVSVYQIYTTLTHYYGATFTPVIDTTFVHCFIYVYSQAQVVFGLNPVIRCLVIGGNELIIFVFPDVLLSAYCMLSLSIT